MIEWMQKHKKYLVITIWVSTIAFIAAGMIGWGQYNFSITGDSVAKVGQINISRQELDQEYRRFYESYAQSIPNFTEEEAKALKLEDNALNFLINQALLRNFALDLGLRVEDSEIIDEITKTDMFQKDGHFDPTLYKQILQENNYRPKDFEESLKNSLLLQKITALLPRTITPLEYKAISSGLALQDKIELLILDTKNIKPQISDTELKDFWERNKTKYQNPAEFSIESIFVSGDSQTFSPAELQEQYDQNKSLYLNDKGELESFEAAKKQVQKDLQMQKAQSEALKKYIELKKSEATNVQKSTFASDTKEYPQDIIQSIQKTPLNETLKPIEYKDGYIVIKVISKKPSAPKDFEQAKKEALSDLSESKKLQLLKLQAQDKLANFKGKDIGFISADFKGKIQGLDDKEVATLMPYIFSSDKKSNFAIIDKKAILFRIVAQDFKAKLDPNMEDLMRQTTQNLKSYFVDEMLVGYLRKKYTIKKY